MRQALLAAALQRVEQRSAKVVVVGQGYVGLPVAMRAVEVGYQVVGYDVTVERVKSLKSGSSYVGDVADATLESALARGYLPSADPADLSDFDIAVISVPTPLRDSAPDMSHIRHAAADLARHLRPGACVVLESTTYPGTTTELLTPLLCELSELHADQFFVGYSPERIDPGNPTYGLVNTPKVVSGADADSLAVVDAFFSTLVDQTVPVRTCSEAEMVKLLENTFRHVNIALVNELAMFAKDLDVDIWRAIDAAATKPFGFMKFTPGPGVGGHCLPIDPSYLAWRVKQNLGHTFRFVELANDVNQHMPDYVCRRASSLLNGIKKSVNGSNVLLLGLAYKRGTTDCRESPSTRVADSLTALGAQVSFSDPLVANIPGYSLPYTLVPFDPYHLSLADLVVILVDHSIFQQSVIVQNARLVLDTRNHLHLLSFEGEKL